MKNGAMTMLLTSSLFTSALIAPTGARAEVKPPDEISAGLAKMLDPEYRALELELRNDPKLSEAVAKYRLQMKSAVKDQKKMQQLSAQFEPNLKALFQRAKIDEEKIKSEGERHIKRMAARKGVSCKSEYIGYLGWWWKCSGKTAPAPKPADKVITLSAPFPLEQKTLNGGGEVETDKQTGRYQTHARVEFAGGHDNTAGLAHFFELDDNYRRVEASIALPETDWYLSAFSDIFAVFGANARSRVEIFSNNRIVCSQEVEHGSLIAPILYFGSRSGTDNVVVDCEIRAPARGDEIVLRAVSVSGAWGGGIGAARARVTATPRDLRLLLKY